MPTRDIRLQLAELYDVDVSPALISKVTDGVMEELRDWQNRPLDPVWPVLRRAQGAARCHRGTWPHAVVQTCVIHLLRNSFRFCSYKDRRAVAKALRPIYTAVNIDGRAKFNRLLAEGDPDGEVYEAWPAPS